MDGIEQVVGLSRRASDIENVVSLQLDITSKFDMKKLSKEPKFDVVVHLAGAAGWCSLEQGMDVNVAGTRNLLDACGKAGTTKFIVASSVAVTGTCSPDFPPRSLPISNDDGFVGSKWAYGLSKAMMEDMIKFMGTVNEDSDYLCIRIGGVVTDPPGPLKHLETAIGVEVVVEAAAASETTTSETFPEFPLCAIALSDITRCFILAVQAKQKAGVRIITAVGPTAFSRQPVAEVMKSWYTKGEGIDLAYHETPGNEFNPVYDTKLASEEIGFVAKIDLREECL